MANSLSLHNVEKIVVGDNDKLSGGTYTRSIIIHQKTPVFDYNANENGVDYIETEFEITVFGQSEGKVITEV
tara:strand:+ start:2593 stop:2808 length:216 start_codon:yes stop_codon:yes gene_type:complete